MSAKSSNISPRRALAILVGGRSQRMGHDKGLLCVNHHPLITHLLHRIGSLFQEILVVCSSEEQRQRYQTYLNHLYPDPEDSTLQVLVDQTSSTRAVTHGIRTALHGTRNTHIIILPVDQLAITPHLLKRLSSHLQPLVAFRSKTELFPFPSLWAKSLLSELPEKIFSVKNFLKTHSHITWLNTTDTEIQHLSLNVNTPEDVTTYERWMTQPEAITL